MLNRRQFIGSAAAMSFGLTTLTGAASTSRSRQIVRTYNGPNVIIVRFGGGVRRRETIDPDHTLAPWLLREFAPRGTLYRNMVIDDAPHIETSHGQGTLHILTGRYDHLINQSEQILGERFEPPSPTLFEYLRSTFDIPPEQALIVNGEDRTSEEFYTFSNHHIYGIDYRSDVLSLFRYKRWLLEQQLGVDQFASDQARREATRKLQEMREVDTRQSELSGQSAAIERLWSSWRGHYGDTGLVNARGDRLITELALSAINDLQPRLMLLNYQDPDYVHWGYSAHYTRGISVIDRSLRSIVQACDHHPAYRNNTVFVVVPDCGRDTNRLLKNPFQHHFNSPSSREIWALMVGPGIERGREINREVQQIDVGPSVAALMGFTQGEMEGSTLSEAFS
ncbi:MAG: hypothetical protein AAF525_12805 [Pseudomonadota bacterium]